jgi:hypothetical protein
MMPTDPLRGQRAEHVVHQRETTRAVTEVFLHSRNQRLVPGHQQVDHLLDAPAPLGGGDGALGDEGGLLRSQQRGQPLGGCNCGTHRTSSNPCGGGRCGALRR